MSATRQRSHAGGCEAWSALAACAFADSGPNLRAQAGHQIHEFGEAGGDHAGVVYCHRMFRRQAHDQEAHGDAVVEMGLDRLAARIAEALAAGDAAHGERGLAFGEIDAVEFEAARDTARRSDSLTRSSSRPVMMVVPSAKEAATART